MGLAEVFAEYLACEDFNENTFSSYLQIIEGGIFIVRES